jgi:hypothetical protein
MTVNKALFVAMQAMGLRLSGAQTSSIPYSCPTEELCLSFLP